MSQQFRYSDKAQHVACNTQVFFLHEQLGQAHPAIQKIKHIHIQYQSNKKGCIMYNPTVHRQQHDSQRHNDQAEQEVYIQRNMAFLHTSSTFNGKDTTF